MSLGYGDIYNLAVNAGFAPGQEANTATAIALAESGGNPGNVNTNYTSDPGGSYGLMQINAHYNPQYFNDPYGNVYDPQTNMNDAYAIAQQAQAAGKPEFSPWSTYNAPASSPYSYQNFIQPGFSGDGSGVANSAPVGSGGDNSVTYSWDGPPNDTSSGNSNFDYATGTPADGGTDYGGSGNDASQGNGGFELPNPLGAGSGDYPPSTSAGIPGLPGLAGGATLPTGGGWWDWFVKVALDFLTRGGLILLGIVLIAGAAWALSREKETITGVISKAGNLVAAE